jgi:hypothetical protein
VITLDKQKNFYYGWSRWWVDAKIVFWCWVVQRCVNTTKLFVGAWCFPIERNAESFKQPIRLVRNLTVRGILY